jgi:uncharacterized Tic20 family protein
MDHEERTLAALANLGVFLPLLGLIGVFSLFLSHKGRNERLQFHFLQAIVVQLAELVYLMFMVVLYLFAIFGSLLFTTFLPHFGQPLLSVLLPILVSILTFAGVLAFFLAGGMAAVTLFSGREFEYPVIASFLKRYLPPVAEEAEG